MTDNLPGFKLLSCHSFLPIYVQDPNLFSGPFIGGQDSICSFPAFHSYVKEPFIPGSSAPSFPLSSKFTNLPHSHQKLTLTGGDLVIYQTSETKLLAERFRNPSFAYNTNTIKLFIEDLKGIRKDILTNICIQSQTIIPPLQPESSFEELVAFIKNQYQKKCINFSLKIEGLKIKQEFIAQKFKILSDSGSVNNKELSKLILKENTIECELTSATNLLTLASNTCDLLSLSSTLEYGFLQTFRVTQVLREYNFENK